MKASLVVEACLGSSRRPVTAVPVRTVPDTGGGPRGGAASASAPAPAGAQYQREPDREAQPSKGLHRLSPFKRAFDASKRSTHPYQYHAPTEKRNNSCAGRRDIIPPRAPSADSTAEKNSPSLSMKRTMRSCPRPALRFEKTNTRLAAHFLRIALHDFGVIAFPRLPPALSPLLKV